jgi:disulfide bond formation protein DsbB
MSALLAHVPPSRWPLFAAGVSLMLLIGAWGFEFIGGYPPCALCYDQRWIHAGVVALGLASGLLLIVMPQFSRYSSLAIFGVAALLAYSAGFAGWHAGIEYGWWEGPATCSATGGAATTLDSIQAFLDPNAGPQNIVMCDEAAWTMFGISMAGYNALISAGLAVLSVLVGLRGLRK